jgi:alkyldihydroxyacetonephosphate synthase
LQGVAHARSASCHLSHSYSDGACLYFTFLAQPPSDEIEATYVAMWDAGQTAALAGGGNLSHHHGIGINRGRFMATALGEGLSVLVAIKHALDPHGILNPGKLGLPSPFGPAPWPSR